MAAPSFDTTSPLSEREAVSRLVDYDMRRSFWLQQVNQPKNKYFQVGKNR